MKKLTSPGKVNPKNNFVNHHAAVDDLRPIGQTGIFLSQYRKLGYWSEDRRGAFPWDMNAWLHQRADLDEIEMVCG